MFFRDKVRGDARYLSDGSAIKGHARYVILPNDETELREGIRYANKGNTKVTIAGNRTGGRGGAVPSGGDIMSMEYLRGVVGVGKDSNGIFVRALACTPISTFNDMVTNSKMDVISKPFEEDYRSMRFPVKVSPSSTVGGCIAVNRSDIRDHVRSIRVVFSDGTFTTIRRGEFFADGRNMVLVAGRNYFSFNLPSYTSDGVVGPKIGDGMDLIDLFIGSEGLFGIITEADIYVSEDVSEGITNESGKMENNQIKERYGQKAVDDIIRIKSILDPNYILNVGNLI